MTRYLEILLCNKVSVASAVFPEIKSILGLCSTGGRYIWWDDVGNLGPAGPSGSTGRRKKNFGGAAQP